MERRRKCPFSQLSIGRKGSISPPQFPQSAEISVSWANRPTEHFTIFEAQNPEVGVIYVVQKSQRTNSKALKL